MAMNKSEQWKLAHLICNQIGQFNNLHGEDLIIRQALIALQAIRDPAPWEYDWHTVILSVAEQRARRLAKQRK